jgi:CheY-like chemotaxis protein
MHRKTNRVQVGQRSRGQIDLYSTMPNRFEGPFVLLVEDSEDDAFFFRWTAGKCSQRCQITHVVDGAAAIRYFEEALAGRAHIPDVVFLDLKIPEFNGFEVLSWLRDHPFNPPLDVCVLSGSEHQSDVERAKSLGATGYQVKPLALEQLEDQLTRSRGRNSNTSHGAGVPVVAPTA